MYQIPTTSKKEKRLLTVTFFVTFASFVILFFKLLDNIVTFIECELENRERLSDLTLLLNSQPTEKTDEIRNKKCSSKLR